MNIPTFFIKKKHRIKIGLDPTNKTLHLGHFVILNQLKELQKMGHTIICIIGTYTAQIGDPSGKNKTRKIIKKKTILYNCKTYETQILTVLKKKNIKFLYNASWLNRLTSKTLIKLMTLYTISRILERKDFKNRFKKQQPLSISELTYPIIQGYDSVIINSSVEIGGTDQKFNLSIGRFLQKKNNQIPQEIYTIPLLHGIDGIKKMSKTINNTINFNEEPVNFFGKIMKIPDNLITEYYRLLLKKNYIIENNNAFKIKMNLAFDLTIIFFGKKKAKIEKNNFIKRFCKKKRNNKNITHTIFITKKQSILTIIYNANIEISKKQIKRLFSQNAIKSQNNKPIEKEMYIEKNCLIFIGKKITVAIKKI